MLNYRNPGSNWPHMIDHGSTLSKNMNPKVFNVVKDIFKKDCEEFWGNYFL